MKQTIGSSSFSSSPPNSCQEEIEPNFSFTNEQEEITIDGNEKAEVTFSFSSSREWEATTTSDCAKYIANLGRCGSSSNHIDCNQREHDRHNTNGDCSSFFFIVDTRSHG